MTPGYRGSTNHNKLKSPASKFSRPLASSASPSPEPSTPGSYVPTGMLAAEVQKDAEGELLTKPSTSNFYVFWYSDGTSTISDRTSDRTSWWETKAIIPTGHRT
eukprot:scaffold33270_cov51-Attheya_sp.AAC.3